MTEWERLQQGLIYNDFDEDLFNRRVEAKKLFRAYNKTDDNVIAVGNPCKVIREITDKDKTDYLKRMGVIK